MSSPPITLDEWKILLKAVKRWPKDSAHDVFDTSIWKNKYYYYNKKGWKKRAYNVALHHG